MRFTDYLIEIYRNSRKPNNIFKYYSPQKFIFILNCEFYYPILECNGFADPRFCIIFSYRNITNCIRRVQLISGIYRVKCKVSSNHCILHYFIIPLVCARIYN